MTIEVGSITEGIVSGITSFGAFINLPGNMVGLVHISEVADAYVKDVKDYLKEQDEVLVKVINIDPQGKIGLSIKQAKALSPREPQEADQENTRERPAARPVAAAVPSSTRQPSSPVRTNQPVRTNPPVRGANFSATRSPGPESFEDKLSKFIKESDQKLSEFRRSTDAKRGGRGAGRS